MRASIFSNISLDDTTLLKKQETGIDFFFRLNQKHAVLLSEY